MTEKIIKIKVDLFKHYNPFRKSSSLEEVIKYIQNNNDGIRNVDLFQEVPIITMISDTEDDFSQKLEHAIDRLEDFNLSWEQVDELTSLDLTELAKKYSGFKLTNKGTKYEA